MEISSYKEEEEEGNLVFRSNIAAISYENIYIDGRAYPSYLHNTSIHFRDYLTRNHRQQFHPRELFQTLIALR